MPVVEAPLQHLATGKAERHELCVGTLLSCVLPSLAEAAAVGTASASPYPTPTSLAAADCACWPVRMTIGLDKVGTSKWRINDPRWLCNMQKAGRL